MWLVSEAGLDVVIVSYRSRDLLRACLASLRDPPRRRCMSSWSTTPRATARPRWSRGVPRGGADRQRREPRLRGRDQPGRSARGRAVRARAQPGHESREGALDHLLDADGRSSRGRDLRLPALSSPERRASTTPPSARFPTPLSALGHFTGLGRRPRAPAAAARLPRARVVRGGPVDAVNGAFMLMRRGDARRGRRSSTRATGCTWRTSTSATALAQAGWLTWYEPAAVATHVKGGSAGPHRSLRLNYAFHYGMYRFYRKHYARLALTCS